MENSPNSQSDHDVLNTLRVKFDLFLSQYKLDMDELKDGTKLMLADHEARLKSIELLRAQLNPEQMAARLTEVVEWKRDFNIKWRTVLGLSIGLSSIITFILTIIAFILNLIK